MSRRVGIEKINLYGCSLFLNQSALALARGKDPEKVVKDFLIERRSLNPAYEDAVTMGANAARPLLADGNAEEIGMLIVGSEGSVDFGKPMSTNIHGALGLHPNVRNYETKHACYSGAAALDTAVNWIASGLNRGKKALIISTDFSRKHFGRQEEFVLGGVAAAAIVSGTPAVIEYELEKKGTWTTNVYDTFRPSARAEVGNNEVSLFSYIDALEGSYADYMERAGEGVDFDSYFSRVVYHTPFPGMSFQAHRTLCNKARPRKRSEIEESFAGKVLPALRYARVVGSTYGSSNFVGLCGLLAGENPPEAGERLGFFAYGSGAIGEFYSGLVLPGAAGAVKEMRIDEALAARREVTVREYEELEEIRDACIENPNFRPDLTVPEGWYRAHYEGKGYLVLKEVKDFYRTYEWS
jgi:3-hydroxy-3-methylglutaryl CoA synthase